MAIRAGLSTHRDPELMANLGRALPVWSDPYLAAAASPHLVGGAAAPEEFHTYLKQAGMQLLDETGVRGSIFKKLGVTGGTQAEKIQALAAKGYDTLGELRGVGFEQRGAMGLAAIVQGWNKPITMNVQGKKVEIPSIQSLYDTYKKEGSETWVEDMIGGIATGDQSTGLAFRQAETKALSEIEDVYGPDAIRSQALDVRRRSQAIEIKRRFGLQGESLLLTPEGMPKRGARIFGVGETREIDREYLESVERADNITRVEKQRLGQHRMMEAIDGKSWGEIVSVLKNIERNTATQAEAGAMKADN